MSKELKIIVSLLVGLILVVIFVSPGAPLGSTPPGEIALVASTTDFALTSGIVTRITSTSTCVARVITTGVNGVGLSFGKPNLANSVGAWQAASTSQAYLASTFGCGAFEARANGATNLVVTETW